MSKGRLITIGSFDGVHLGHMALLDRTVKEAKKRRLIPTALTFQVPPRMVLDRKNKKSLLSTFNEKKWLMERKGIRDVRLLPFDRKFSKSSPFLFFRDILLRKGRAKGLVVGLDFRFGKNRSAGATELVRWGLEYEIPVWVIPSVRKGLKKISSSRIREALVKGTYRLALQLLGHHYLISGEVKKDRGVGKKLGFPTANLRMDPSKILPTGVFAVKGWVKNRNRPYKGVCNIGYRPTLLKNSKLVVEVHFFSPPAKLLGKTITLEMQKHLRPEKKFSGRNELVRAIQKDIKKAKQYFQKQAEKSM